MRNDFQIWSKHPELANVPLAGQWVKERLEAYQSPIRKGTPRNMPRGFPDHKQAAACLHVFYGGVIKTTKVLGDLAGASPALVRNWRREDRFSGAVAKDQRDFALYFVEGLLSSASDRRFSLLAELSSYSPGARKEILVEIQRRLSAPDSEEEPRRRIIDWILLNLILRMAEWEPANSDAFREAMEAGKRLLTRHHEEIQKRVSDPESAYHLELLKTMADRSLEIARVFKNSPRTE
jgi:hypothetical protein